VRRTISLSESFIDNKKMPSDQKCLRFVQEGALERLSSNDWPLWRSLRLQALAEAPYAFGSKLADWQGAGDIEARWRERLTAVPFNLIAVLRNYPAGMMSATEPDSDGTVELISLWVAPSVRGCGVGDALIEAAIGWAVEQKASQISLDVTEGNRYATKLYVRHGFLESGNVVVNPADETSEFRFVKSLASC
jgi:ribosomal protein S18 acetylase RimI-like enzyme